MAKRKPTDYSSMSEEELNQFSVEDLRGAATEADIAGRSQMNKAELIEALRNQRPDQSDQDQPTPRDSDEDSDMRRQLNLEGQERAPRTETDQRNAHSASRQTHQSDAQDREDQSGTQEQSPAGHVASHGVNEDRNWNPPVNSGGDPAGGGIAPDSERILGTDDTLPPMHGNTRMDPVSGQLRRIPRNHPDFDPRQESVSTNPNRNPPAKPADDEWPDPLEPSAADQRQMEETGIPPGFRGVRSETDGKAEPKQMEMGGTGPFVRVGNRIINMAHVTVINITNGGSDLYPGANLSLDNGGALNLDIGETTALMHALGDCCSEELERQEKARQRQREMFEQRTTPSEKQSKQAREQVKKAPKPQGPSRAEREG